MRDETPWSVMSTDEKLEHLRAKVEEMSLALNTLAIRYGDLSGVERYITKLEDQITKLRDEVGRLRG